MTLRYASNKYVYLKKQPMYMPSKKQSTVAKAFRFLICLPILPILLIILAGKELIGEKTEKKELISVGNYNNSDVNVSYTDSINYIPINNSAPTVDTKVDVLIQNNETRFYRNS